MEILHSLCNCFLFFYYYPLLKTIDIKQEENYGERQLALHTWVVPQSFQCRKCRYFSLLNSSGFKGTLNLQQADQAGGLQGN
jgi:hypothetical protein